MSWNAEYIIIGPSACRLVRSYGLKWTDRQKDPSFIVITFSNVAYEALEF